MHRLRPRAPGGDFLSAIAGHVLDGRRADRFVSARDRVSASGPPGVRAVNTMPWALPVSPPGARYRARHAACCRIDRVRWSEEVARTKKLKKATQTRERIARSVEHPEVELTSNDKRATEPGSGLIRGTSKP
jgi:hypothetical protein